MKLRATVAISSPEKHSQNRRSPVISIGAGKTLISAGLERLKPLLKERLNKALDDTKGITAHLDLFDHRTGNLMFVVAVGENATAYDGSQGPSPQGVTRLAARENRSIFVEDVRTSPQWHAAITEAKARQDEPYVELLESFKSEAAITLPGPGDNALGVINVHYSEKNGFARRKGRVEHVVRAAFSDVVQKIADVIPDAIAFEGAVRTREMNEAIRRIRKQFKNGMSLWNLIVQEGVGLSGADFVALWMHHSCSKELHLAAFARARNRGFPYRSVRVRADEGIRGEAIRQGQTCYADFTLPNCPWKPCVEGLGSSYVMPIKTEDGHTLGVLCFNFYRAAGVPSGLGEALEDFGELCSLLISRTVAESEARVARELQRVLQEAGDCDSLMRRTVEVTRRLLSAQGVSLFLIEPDGKTMKLGATTGLANGYDADTTYQLDESGLTPWVARNGSVLRLRNCGDRNALRRVDELLRWTGKTREIHSREGDRRPFLAVPVRTHSGNILGVLRASDKVNGAEFSEEDTIAMLKIARSLACELPRPRAVLESLAADIERSWANLQVCLDILLRRCCEVSGADVGSIFVTGKDSVKICSVRGALTIDKGEWMATIESRGVNGLCARTQCVQVLPDVTAAEWAGIYKPCFAGIQSEIAVPLLFMGELLGVINLESTNKDHFNAEVQARIRALAGVAAGYVAHRRMAEANHSIDEIHRYEESRLGELKENLFKPLDIPPGTELRGHVIRRICGAGVGGDFYDSMRIDDFTIGIVIGDGEGHGVLGAVNMLPLVSAFRTHKRRLRSTQQVIERLQIAAREMHVVGTALYFTIARTRKVWRLVGSSAGHPPLLIVRARGGYERFPDTIQASLGTAGVVDQSRIADSIELYEGDLVIALTDGISDCIWASATNPAQSLMSQVGSELSILGAISSVFDGEPQEIASAIEHWALNQSGGELIDDATVVVLKMGRWRPE